MRVYILSTYGEYGAENVRASTSKETIKKIHLELCDKYMVDCKEAGYTKENLDKVSDSIRTEALNLQEILLEDELTGSTTGQDLSDGWGGFQLHIIELE